MNGQLPADLNKSIFFAEMYWRHEQNYINNNQKAFLNALA